MTEFSNRQIPAPLNWEEFESLCCDLWTEILDDQNTSKNGRSGQSQNGVDVFGRKDGKGAWVGIQCKGKNGQYGKRIEKTELIEEIEKAKTFSPKISEFILATTAENDVNIQEVARRLSEENANEGLFSVTVVAWSEMVRKLSFYEAIIEKYYPNQSLRLTKIETNIEDLVDASLLQNSHEEEIISRLSRIESILEKPKTSISSGDGHSVSKYDGIEEIYNEEIDGYRDALNSGKCVTAKELLTKIKGRCWDNSSSYIKFRIITNIAACDLRLENQIDAINGFRNAFQYAEDNEIANANLILAYILEKDYASAYRLAIASVKKFPRSETILSYYIISYPLEDKQINPVKLIPEELSNSAVIAYSIYEYYRRKKNTKRVKKWIKKAYGLSPNQYEIKLSYAFDLLESIALSQAFTVGKQISDKKMGKLTECKKILYEMFGEITASEELVFLESVSNNLAVSLKLLNDHGEAIDVVKKALISFPDSKSLLRLKATLHIDLEEWQEALEMLSKSQFTDRFEKLLVETEALNGIGNHFEAKELVEQYLKIESDPARNDVLTSYMVELLYQLESYEAAISYGNQSVDKKSSVWAYLSMSKIHRHKGIATEARNCTLIALGNRRDIASYGETFMTAEEAYLCGLLTQSKELFSLLTKMYVDSPPLRRLVACLYELDDRSGMTKLLENLPADVAEKSFFSKYSIAFFTKVGDENRAEREIDRYLSNHPSDLNVALNKIGLLYRNNRREEAEEFVDNLVDVSGQLPLDQMHLTFVYADMGKKLQAIELAYQLRRVHYEDAGIHERYAGLVFSGKVSDVIGVHTEVAIKTSVVVKHKGIHSEYYICGEDETPLGDNEIPVDHPISSTLLGSKVGGLVTYRENPVTTRTITVVEIKSKYKYLLHDTINKFSHRFPDENAMYSLELSEDSEGDFDFSPVFRSIDQHRSYVDQGMKLYKEQLLPLGVLAKYLNVEPINLWYGMQNDEDRNIYCAQGTQVERDAAFDLISTPKTYVVDPLTAVQLIDLEIVDVVQALLGNLSITRSALDVIDKAIEKERQFSGKAHMTLTKIGNDYVKHEVSSDEIEAKIGYLETIKHNLRDKFNIVAAIGRPPLSQDVSEFLSLIDLPFVDAIYASANDGFCLLSHDLRLRYLAQSSWSVDSVWVQPVLMMAVSKGLIDSSKYAEIIYQYINRGFEFVSIDRNVLLLLAKENSFEVSDKFVAVCKTLDIDNLEFLSIIEVVLGALNDIWLGCKNNWKYEAFVYTLLNCLTANCTRTNTLFLLRHLDNQGEQIAHGLCSEAIRKWAKGHFLADIFQTG